VVNSGPDLEQALASQPAEVSIVDIEMPGVTARHHRRGGTKVGAIVVSMYA
jgi:hypothetical protein